MLFSSIQYIVITTELVTQRKETQLLCEVLFLLFWSVFLIGAFQSVC